jgi:predicted DNA-binding protein (MmcQ/YjbR family)
MTNAASLRIALYQVIHLSNRHRHRYTAPMTRDEFNAYCASLTATTHVVQWGDADVWKIGGKVFAICGWNDGADAFTFKVSKIAFEVLREQPGIRPAPYLASRGFSWLQHHAAPGLADDDLKDHIRASYEMIAGVLSKNKQAELGYSNS